MRKYQCLRFAGNALDLPATPRAGMLRNIKCFFKDNPFEYEGVKYKSYADYVIKNEFDYVNVVYITESVG